MATTNKSAELLLADAAKHDIYTVPASTSATLEAGVIVSNTSSDPAEVKVFLYDGGAAAAHQIADLTLGAGESKVIAPGLVLTDGDKIQAQAGRGAAVEVAVTAVETDGATRQQVLTVAAPAVAQAVDAENAVGVVLNDGTISSVTYFAKATLTGTDTDSRTLNLLNKTGPKTAASKAFTNGVNATALAATAITNGSAGNRAVVAGDELTIQSVHVGAGLADPGGLIRVVIDLA